MIMMFWPPRFQNIKSYVSFYCKIECNCTRNIYIPKNCGNISRDAGHLY